MTAPIFDLAAQLRSHGTLNADDALAMRRVAWPDGKIDPAEAEAIFDLNTAVKGSSREWVDFFVEAMSDYIVHQQSPEGYVDDAKAAWLMSKIDSDGRVDSLGELELLVKVLETATNVPDSLKTYALKQIETIVLTGDGPTRDGGALDAGSISSAEVKLLRRMLYAQASEGPAAISLHEAEMLFRLKDATLDAHDDPEWATLFVQCVGNFLMAHSDYHPLERPEAARLDAFMNDTSVNIGGFFGRMASAGLSGFRDLVRSRPVPADRDAAVAADRAIAPEEAAWLHAEIDADHKLDALEKALLKFVAEESGQSL